MSHPKLSPESLDHLQRVTFDYFLHETNMRNGLVADKTMKGSPASIAAVGLALTAYPVGIERGFIKRGDAIQRVRTTLKFFRDAPQSDAPDATGYKGFYYHFLDMNTGKRVWKSELSTVDSAFFFAGMLTAASYFTADNAEEREIRALAEELYRRADWRWAQNGGLTITHGWRPESGFLPYRWEGYDEALFMYLLALGSPSFAIGAESYAAWTSTYEWRNVYDDAFLFAGPLFTHQISHIWVDFRGIQDKYMRGKSIDYFENSRRATYAQQKYAILNPRKFDAYGENCWGITASDGPGDMTRTIRGVERKFFGYLARGVPNGPDDGSIAPWAVVASLPFAPEIVLPALRYFEDIKLHMSNPYGFKATFNPTFSETTDPSRYWTSPWHYGINQGPIVLMIENFRSGLLWQLSRGCKPLMNGLRQGGFSGGWLGPIT